MGDLSKDFSRWEFACKCGCGFDDVSPELIEVLQALRDWWQRPIKINSACRCVEYNESVGGSEKSQHLLGTAADIVIQGVPAESVQRTLLLRYKDKYGIGSYDSFTHIDVRPTKARWSE